MDVGVVACNRLMKVASEGAVSIHDSSHREAILQAPQDSSSSDGSFLVKRAL